jgi:flagellar biosynthesis/type III secretory pathway protein FliH
MSPHPYPTHEAFLANRDVRRAEWSVPKPTAVEVAALFAPPKAKPLQSAKTKNDSKHAAPSAPSPETRERLVMLASALIEAAEARRADKAQTVELIIDIALAIAEELAMGAVEADKSRLVRLVGESVGLMDDGQRMRVKLHPELIAFLESAGTIASLAADSNLVVEADPSVGERGCVVESTTQRVDGRMTARIGRLRALLRSEEGVAK